MSLEQDAIDSVVHVGGVALLERLVEVAEGNVRDRLQQLEQALASEPPDLAAIERAAHSMKSSAAYLGIGPLRQHAAEMETDAHEGHIDGFSERAEEAERLLEQALPLLREEIDRRKR